MNSYPETINYPLLLLKWLSICSLNAAASFILAFDTDYDRLYDVLSMVAGVITFVFIYTYFEVQMIKQEQHIRRKIMLFGVISHIPLELYPAVDMILGILSIGFVSDLLGIRYPFEVYLITMTQGSLLSMFCLLLGGVIYGIYALIAKHRRNDGDVDSQRGGN